MYSPFAPEEAAAVLECCGRRPIACGDRCIVNKHVVESEPFVRNTDSNMFGAQGDCQTLQFE